MFFLLAAGLLLYAISKSGAPAHPPAVAMSNWNRFPSGIMVNGQHYFFAIPWTGSYDPAQVGAAVGLLFDGSKVWGPKESAGTTPSPMPADWLPQQAMGYAVGHGVFKAGQNAPIDMKVFLPLGANPTGQPILWESTDDYVKKVMTAQPAGR